MIIKKSLYGLVVLLDRLRVLLLHQQHHVLHEEGHGVQIALVLDGGDDAGVETNEVGDDFEGVLAGGEDGVEERLSHAVLRVLGVDVDH